MIPAKLALEPFSEGDDWDGIPAITITINHAAPAVAMGSVTMRFRQTGVTKPTIVELSSGTPSQIAILDAAVWNFQIPVQPIPELTAGRWMWRLRITDAVGRKRTYLADEIVVLENI